MRIIMEGITVEGQNVIHHFSDLGLALLTLNVSPFSWTESVLLEVSAQSSELDEGHGKPECDVIVIVV